MSWMFRSSVIAAVALFAAGSTPGQAAVFNIVANNIGVNCGASCGTVTVIDNGNNSYSFNVDLSSALVLHTTPGNPDTVAFNLTGVTSSSGGVVTQPSSNVPMDGFGNFNFGVDCSTTIAGNICVPNGQSPLNDLIFTIFAPSGQTLAGNFVALDVAQTTNTANTGFAGVPGPIVGAGLPGLIAACGALLGLARRRRKLA